MGSARGCPEPERLGAERTTPVSVRDVARLDRELATVLGARPRDPKACADVLERAAFACRTDPAAAQQWVEAELLDELVDCYQALGRVDEADHRDAPGPATPPTYIGPVTHPTICAGTFETDTSGGFWVA